MKYINSIMDFLDGKKTFIGAVVIFVGGGLRSVGAIDDETFKIIEALGLAITAYGLRTAIKKLE